MRLVEELGLPLLTVIDTRGAARHACFHPYRPKAPEFVGEPDPRAPGQPRQRDSGTGSARKARTSDQIGLREGSSADGRYN